MLQVDIRELRKGPVETAATLDAEDPVLAGLGVSFGGPVTVAGVLQGIPERRTFKWAGQVSGVAHAECRRCLAPVRVVVEVGVQALFSPDPDAADDPGVYPIREPVAQIDLTPAVREELLLAAPSFVLCREDCAGLCQRCGADLNSGPCTCAPAAEPA